MKVQLTERELKRYIREAVVETLSETSDKSARVNKKYSSVEDAKKQGFSRCDYQDNDANFDIWHKGKGKRIKVQKEEEPHFMKSSHKKSAFV